MTGRTRRVLDRHQPFPVRRRLVYRSVRDSEAVQQTVAVTVSAKTKFVAVPQTVTAKTRLVAVQQAVTVTTKMKVVAEEFRRTDR